MREFVVFTHILYQKRHNISSCYYKHDNFILAPWRVIVLIQVCLVSIRTNRQKTVQKDRSRSQ